MTVMWWTAVVIAHVTQQQLKCWKNGVRKECTEYFGVSCITLVKTVAWIHFGFNIPSELMLIICCGLLDLQQGLRLTEKKHQDNELMFSYWMYWTPSLLWSTVPMNYSGYNENKLHRLVDLFTTWSGNKITWKVHFVFHVTPAMLNNKRGLKYFTRI